MNRIQNNTVYIFFGGGLYIFLALIAGIPIWLAIHAYMESLGVHNDEAAATGATMFCIAGIFTGRYLIGQMTIDLTVMPVRLMSSITILVLACVIWLFIYPNITLLKDNPIHLVFYWGPFIFMCIGTGALIKIASTVNRNRIKAAQTAAEISKSELQLLQSKLSPHFLFNTLNNLYGISITRHEKIPALLLKLSDLLRYSVYDVNETYVQLKDEIAYLHNYIDFEKIRIGDRLVLNMDLPESVDPSIKIAPMLLIIFIENAFKHAKNTSDKKIFIEIRIKISENAIIFYIMNSHSRAQEKTGISGKHSGFGLVSAARRLELLYAGQHKLTIKNEEIDYQVTLQLTIK